MDACKQTDPIGINGGQQLIPAKASKTILLLEDEGIIAIELVEACERRGYLTEARTSVRDAEKWLETSQPDAAIVDCILCDGDCSHLVLRLRQQNIPVVVYTGRHTSELGIAFEGLKIFTKPSSVETLLQAVEERLAGEDFHAHTAD